MKTYWPVLWLAAIFVATSLSCSGLQPDPQTVQKYPWIAQPLRAETKVYFCQQLDLKPEHPICRSDRNVMAVDLLRVLQQRFPENKTTYAEVEKILKGYVRTDSENA